MAQEIVEALGTDGPPVDLYELASQESDFLTVLSGDYADAFDGELQYSAPNDHFLLFFNTRYDRYPHEGRHHPRSRFSFAHELGHYYLEHHRDYLRSGGASHQSKGEFENDVQIEREADAFASALMMPETFFKPRVNDGQELSVRRVRELAEKFQTSLTSTATRAVRLADQPCAIVAIRSGERDWSFQASIMVEAKCYPAPKGPLRSPTASAAWEAFVAGNTPVSAEGSLEAWFTSYNRRDFENVLVTESYLPVPSMETLLVLLTMDEDDLFG